MAAGSHATASGPLPAPITLDPFRAWLGHGTEIHTGSGGNGFLNNLLIAKSGFEAVGILGPYPILPAQKHDPGRPTGKPYQPYAPTRCVQRVLWSFHNEAQGPGPVLESRFVTNDLPADLELMGSRQIGGKPTWSAENRPTSDYKY